MSRSTLDRMRPFFGCRRLYIGWRLDEGRAVHHIFEPEILPDGRTGVFVDAAVPLDELFFVPWGDEAIPAWRDHRGRVLIPELDLREPITIHVERDDPDYARIMDAREEAIDEAIEWRVYAAIDWNEVDPSDEEALDALRDEAREAAEADLAEREDLESFWQEVVYRGRICRPTVDWVPLTKDAAEDYLEKVDEGWLGGIRPYDGTHITLLPHAIRMIRERERLALALTDAPEDWA